MTVSFPTPNIGDGWMPAFGLAVADDVLGHEVLIDWCVSLLTEKAGGADRLTPSLRWLAGDAAGSDFNRNRWSREDLAYWPRVWAARGLRYVWDDRAAPAVITGLYDRAWRVREHCCAITGFRELADAADRLAELTDPDQEDNVRVRLAAVKALALVGEHEHAAAISRAVDSEPKVSAAAKDALHVLAERLDRVLD